MRIGTVIKDLLGAVCCGLPFLFDQAHVAIWIGLAILLHSQLDPVARFKFLRLYLASSLALAVPLHWAAEAMAFTMDAPLAIGFCAAGLLLAVESFRIALTIWLGVWLASGWSTVWIWSASVAIVFEAWFPTTIPWRFGYALVEISWLLQPCEWFGSAFSTLVAFAGAGIVLQILVQGTEWFTSKKRYDLQSSGCLDAYTRQVSLVCHLRQGVPNTRLSRMGRWSAVLFLIATATVSLYQQWSWQRQESQSASLRVGLVQVLPKQPASLETARRLSNGLADKVDLICWPESMGGTYQRDLTGFADEQQVKNSSLPPDQGLQPWPQASLPLLLGGRTYREKEHSANQTFITAMLIEPGTQSILGRCDKRFLMPFGEYVPLQSHFPFLREVFGNWDKLTSGPKTQTIRLRPKVHLGVLLCYEDMVSEAARDSVRQGANLLVSLIDGSSFISRRPLAQHRQLAQLRAIESRRYLLRCASTGQTCVVRPSGQIAAALPLEVEGSLVARVRLSEYRTLYNRLGETLPYVGLALIAGRLLTSRRRA